MYMAADSDTCISLSVHTQMNIMCAVFSLCTSSAKLSSLFWENVFLQLRKAVNTGYIFLPLKEEEDGLQIKKTRQQKIKNIVVVVLTCSNWVDL